ncbi:MAG TPA: hypothetical protein VJZ26_16190 [Blastocatellia bacterium]|nr:hypothetical protein [Blastocatellia bacterium]
MRHIFRRTSLLALIAAVFVSGLPIITQHSSTTSGASAEAQTRRGRRPVIQRRTTGTNTALVPVGTNLRVRLNNDISSKDARIGDRFTATVVNPARYDGARVNGHVRSIRKSGRVQGRTTMVLAFDSIELSEGRTGPMRGEVIRIYDSGGKVDEEGRVESGSRGKQTLKRGGIGAAAGAIIGGIAGGGKGAAIGLILGGAGGAGSIAINGSKELKLENGTEMLVRVTRR